MNAFHTVCRILIWVLLAVTVLFQTAAILGMTNILGLPNNNSSFDYLPLIGATILMVLSVIFFFALPRWKMLPLLAAFAAAVLFVITALAMKDAFPVHMAADGSDQGLTAWRLIYRHLSPVLIPLLMLPLFNQYRNECALQNPPAEQQENMIFPELSEDINPDDTMETDDFLPKRSVRTRKRKQAKKNREQSNV